MSKELGRVYSDGQVIVRQGEEGDCMFAIQTGRVEVLRETEDGEVRVGVLEAGDLFGEMAILQKEVRSATVRALGEARALSIDKRTFLRRVQEDPSLAMNLAHRMAERIRKANAEISALRHEIAVRDAAAGPEPGAASGAPA